MNHPQPDSYTTECQACGGLLAVQTSQIGHRGRCPLCRKSIVVSSVRPAELNGEQAAGNFTTTVAVSCAKCDTSYDVPKDKLGRTGTCKKCGERFTLTSSETLSGEEVDQARPQADSFRRTLGEQIGRFTIGKHLGSGEFGEVYQAQDTLLKRDVVIKLPHVGLFANETRRSRFLREPQAAAGLRHPNIVPIYDAGLEGDQFFIASAFIDGQTLQARLEENRPDFRQAARMLIALAEALDYAHGQGIVHRDIKPANIMLDQKEAPLLMDFGLARLREAEDQLTHDGAVLGTPAYMAPEQAAGNQQEVGPASDQYSLGVLLYELLSGERPFKGPAAAVISMLTDQEPPSPRTHNPAITRDLETICQKAMAKRPPDRYPSCSELADDLRRWLNNEPIEARRVGIAERLVRWVKREPRVAALAASVLLVLVGGIMVSTIFATRANQSARVALAAERIADDKAQEALASATALEKKTGEATALAKLAEQRADALQPALDEAQKQKAKADANAQEATEAKAIAVQRADALQPALDEAQKQKAEAEATAARLERSLYASDMNLAQRHWDNADIAGVLRLLEKHKPASVADDLRGWEWFYQWRLCHTDLRTLKGHSHSVRCVTFSPDGRRLASASYDKTVKIWDAESGEELRTLTGHSAEVHCVTFSPDGSRLASADLNSTVKIWDATILTPDEKMAQAD